MSETLANTELLAEAAEAAGAIAGTVVGEHAGDGDAEAGVVVDGGLEEGGRGRGFLVGKDLKATTRRAQRAGRSILQARATLLLITPDPLGAWAITFFANSSRKTGMSRAFLWMSIRSLRSAGLLRHNQLLRFSSNGQPVEMSHLGFCLMRHSLRRRQEPGSLASLGMTVRARNACSEGQTKLTHYRQVKGGSSYPG